MSTTAAATKPATCPTAAPAGLPWSTVRQATPAAPEDPGSAYTGQTATPTQEGTAVFAGPSACSTPVAFLPRETLGAPTSLPVIGSEAGWLHVLLPSRRNLPSAGRGAASVNHASGWIQAAAATLTAAPLQIAVDQASKKVTLLDAGKAVFEAPVEMDGGSDSTTGRTFVVGIYKTPASEQCSGQPLIVTAHQSAREDSYEGSGAAVQALHGFSWSCRLTLLSGQTPGCTIISDAAVAELLARGVKPGTVVTVK
ncbi:hypothetical protein B5P43_15800 [Bacillus sp. SRB_336]|nr:hypothetical protein B5P43_15800 [Bacillus sp. SRB_336]